MKLEDILKAYYDCGHQIENLQSEKRKIDMDIKHIESNESKLKDMAIEIMNKTGECPTVEGISFTVQFNKPKVIVTDESKIPDKFFKIEKKLDKASLNKAYNDGEPIEGISLDNGSYSIFKRKAVKC